jgi:hypothetical protein
MQCLQAVKNSIRSVYAELPVIHTPETATNKVKRVVWLAFGTGMSTLLFKHTPPLFLTLISPIYIHTYITYTYMGLANDVDDEKDSHKSTRIVNKKNLINGVSLASSIVSSISLGIAFSHLSSAKANVSKPILGHYQNSLDTLYRGYLGVSALIIAWKCLKIRDGISNENEISKVRFDVKPEKSFFNQIYSLVVLKSNDQVSDCQLEGVKKIFYSMLYRVSIIALKVVPLIDFLYTYQQSSASLVKRVSIDFAAGAWLGFIGRLKVWPSLINLERYVPLPVKISYVLNSVGGMMGLNYHLWNPTPEMKKDVAELQKSSLMDRVNIFFKPIRVGSYISPKLACANLGIEFGRELATFFFKTSSIQKA